MTPNEQRTERPESSETTTHIELDPLGDQTVVIDGNQLTLTSLDKVYYPGTGTTKRDVMDYYLRVAPTIIPHLEGRPLNLKRYPEGVSGTMFYQRNCPVSRPPWMSTLQVPSKSSKKGKTYCTVRNTSDLLWLINMSDLELHPFTWKEGDHAQPTYVVFDLDPGDGVGVTECCEIARVLRTTLEQMGITALPKTSGGKGIHIFAPIRQGPHSEAVTAFARTIAGVIERSMPGEVTSNMRKSERVGRVFIDWSQNAAHKSTVAPYSLRAKHRPSVSTPVTWQEIDAAANDPDSLTFGPDDVLRRIERHGDLMAPLLEPGAPLPDWALEAGS